ncbi:MAG: response regulator [Nitrospinaceae bacterium]
MGSQKPKVLIVDDEKKILSVAKKLLSREGYELLTSVDAEEALGILEDKGPIAVVVSDNRMPSMRGTEFFKRIKTLCPETVRILMTAYYDAQLIEDVVNTGEAYRYLKKPLDFKTVQKTIEAGIHQYERNLEVKNLGLECSKLNNEKSQLENQSLKLKEKVSSLAQIKKKLIFALMLMAVGFGIFEVSRVWLDKRGMETTSQKIGHWVKYTNGTAMNSKTGLIWMTRDFRNLEKRAPGNWKEAMAWAEKMNQRHYGGFTDWRVPTITEYQTTFDSQAKRLGFDRNRKFPVGYAAAFEDGGGYGYWSREEVGQNSARYFFFVGGYGKTENKEISHATFSVRLVRN